MAINLISDFDQTLINLSIDWKEFRRIHGLNRVVDIWKLPIENRESTLASLSHIEIAAAAKSDFHPVAMSILKENLIGILTNNSESAVRVMLERAGDEDNFSNQEVKIYGRESLKGPKENFELFQEAINAICVSKKVDSRDVVYYAGDSEYEILYARKMGLKPIHIFSNSTSLF